MLSLITWNNYSNILYFKKEKKKIYENLGCYRWHSSLPRIWNRGSTYSTEIKDVFHSHDRVVERKHLHILNVAKSSVFHFNISLLRKLMLFISSSDYLVHYLTKNAPMKCFLENTLPRSILRCLNVWAILLH